MLLLSIVYAITVCLYISLSLYLCVCLSVNYILPQQLTRLTG